MLYLKLYIFIKLGLRVVLPMVIGILVNVTQYLLCYIQTLIDFNFLSLERYNIPQKCHRLFNVKIF